MLMFYNSMDGMGGNGAKVFQCTVCGRLVTRSDRFLSLDGKKRHNHVNPSGVECDFHTFYSCPGAIALGNATSEYTWFPRYAWRMAFCRQCGQHLGWHYERTSRFERPSEFWGILLSSVASE